MPFDPSLPADHAKADAAQMRDQLTSLKALIDAVPVISAALVDNVSTSNPGDAAQATVSLVGNELRFTFVLPRGDVGPPGMDGAQGAQGLQGAPGEVTFADMSAALAAAVAGTSSNTNTVNTLPSGAPATYEPLAFQMVVDKINELIGALRR